MVSFFGCRLAAASRYDREPMGDAAQRLTWRDQDRFGRFITIYKAISE